MEEEYHSTNNLGGSYRDDEDDLSADQELESDSEKDKENQVVI